MKSVAVGNGVTLDNQEFFGCNQITFLHLNCHLEKDKTIKVGEGGDVFESCKDVLKTVSFGEDVSSIEGSIFEGFSALTNIYLSSGVKTIEERAFANCDKLENVYCYGVKYPSVAANTFEGSYVDYVTLHVPAKSLNQYKAHAVWGKFMEIVPLTDEEMAIGNIILNETEVKDVYDLNGRRNEQLQQGLNIIRTQDGKTMKVWVK